VNNWETPADHQMLAIRTVRARSASAKARQTNPTGASLPRPAGKEVGFGAAEAVSGLRILYAICLRREQQKAPGLPGAFDAWP